MAIVDNPDTGSVVSRTFSATLWQHPGNGGWHFVTLPADLADETRARAGAMPRPFGSIGVRAAIGPTSWNTSLFADRARGSYLLPVKADVRRRAGVGAGDTIVVTLDLPA